MIPHVSRNETRLTLGTNRYRFVPFVRDSLKTPVKPDGWYNYCSGCHLWKRCAGGSCIPCRPGRRKDGDCGYFEACE